MSNKRDVLIWIPLPPNNSWRGEGIAQTIENIVRGIENLKIGILVNAKHYNEISEAIGNKDNVAIYPLSLKWLLFRKLPLDNFNSSKKQQYISSPLDIPDKTNSFNAFNILLKKLGIKRLRRPFELLSKVGWYSIKLGIFTVIQRSGYFSNYNHVWIPIPIIYWSESLKGKKLVSFWDPFVFEYREFSDVVPYLYVKFASLFKNSDHYITQSETNKEYLVKIFGVKEDKVTVIYNGSPDYSHYIAELNDCDIKNNFINKWPKPQIVKGYDRATVDRMRTEVVNHSMLFRLNKRLNSNSKIILVSTQARIYKGFPTLFKVIKELLSIDSNIYFIFTAEISQDLRKEYQSFHENIFEITRVSNKQHAVLYALSDLVVHPSYVEGGLGCYPQFEAASIGKPCLVNRGRHTDELIRNFGTQLENVICDFTDIRETAKRITNLLNDSNAKKANIDATKTAFIDWADISKKYEKVFYRCKND